MGIITIDQFRASGVDVEEIGTKIPGQDLEGCAGRVYLDTLHIEYWMDGRHGNAPPNGPTWLLTLGNEQHQGALADMELELYRWALSDGHLVTDGGPVGVRREFPDFNPFDIPLVLLDSGWSDQSWHNDAMPFFLHEPSGVGVWVNDPEDEHREIPGRFLGMAMQWDRSSRSWMHSTGANVALFDAEDEDALARSLGDIIRPRAIAHSFALDVEELGNSILAEIRRRNAMPEYDQACATHDFVDANMLMLDAFKEGAGHPFLPPGDVEPSQADFELWNRAWDIAKSERLSEPRTEVPD